MSSTPIAITRLSKGMVATVMGMPSQPMSPKVLTLAMNTTVTTPHESNPFFTHDLQCSFTAEFEIFTVRKRNMRMYVKLMRGRSCLDRDELESSPSHTSFVPNKASFENLQKLMYCKF